MIGVLLVDDQELVRAGMQRILEFETDLRVVAEAADGAAAIAAVDAGGIDVVLMDIRMPVMDGIEATRRLRDGGGPPVLVLTTFDEDAVLWGAIDAGAAGFILKEASAEDLTRAVRIVATGGAWLDPAVTPRVLSVYQSTVLPAARDQARTELLTEREHDVLRLLAAGSTNQEIATALSVGHATVKTHVSAILSKLGARDRAAAIIYAYRHGLVV